MNIEERKERLFELLADQTLFGLNEQESSELNELQIEFPEFKNDNSFEKAALAISLGNLNTNNAMPQNLQAQILADADKFFESNVEVAENTVEQEKYVSSGALPTETPNADIRTITYDSPKPSFMQWLGWGFAALACIALVANIWLTRVNPNTDVVTNPTPTATPKKELTPAEKKQQFLASVNDLIKTSVASPDEKNKELTGEIAWSNTKQEGYVTVKGLPKNDKNKETYQLWIFDETQDEATPIDGGIFDIDENGEVIIPINAKIDVKKPKMFAVTVEKPGGTVVSKRDKIVALAKVEA